MSPRRSRLRTWLVLGIVLLAAAEAIVTITSGGLEYEAPVGGRND